jgi:hypothetical protein
MKTTKRIFSIAIPLLVCVVLVGCSLQTIEGNAQDVASDAQTAVTDAQTALTALQKNRQLVEQFASDIKRSLPPEDEAYQTAQNLYNTARGLNDEYLAKASLAALTNDNTVSLDAPATAAHTAATTFTQSATRTLSPATADRAIPFAMAVAALPLMVHKIFAPVPANKKSAIVQQVCKKVRWRSWGEL